MREDMRVIIYDLDAEEDEEYEWLFNSKKEALEQIQWWKLGDYLEGKSRTYVIEKYEEVN